MAFINARITNTNTVAGILADFQEKVNLLNVLAEKRKAAIEARTSKIQELVSQNGNDQYEADSALAAANKIKSLFN